jgi:hypothetical protein
MSERYVQHKSGQGEKWKVYQGDLDRFKDLYFCEKDMISYALPKSEYIECAAPEVWTECTREVVTVNQNGRSINQLNDSGLWHAGVTAIANPRYRWSWRGDALIIERKQP